MVFATEQHEQLGWGPNETWSITNTGSLSVCPLLIRQNAMNICNEVKGVLLGQIFLNL